MCYLGELYFRFLPVGVIEYYRVDDIEGIKVSLALFLVTEKYENLLWMSSDCRFMKADLMTQLPPDGPTS